MTGKRDREDARWNGYILTAAGGLIGLLCGTCTWNGLHNGDPFYRPLAYVGVAPIAFGVWLFVGGPGRVLTNREP